MPTIKIESDRSKLSLAFFGLFILSCTKNYQFQNYTPPQIDAYSIALQLNRYYHGRDVSLLGCYVYNELNKTSQLVALVEDALRKNGNTGTD